MLSLPSLPEPIQYLQPFLATLSELPPEELDDVDSSPLKDLLRQRIEGLEVFEAEQVLSDDRELLEQWLTGSGDVNHPSHWLFGFLASPPHLVDELLQPSQDADAGLKVTMEPPSGWKIKHLPPQLELTHRKVWASVTAVDEFHLEIQRTCFSNWSAPPPLEMTLEALEVTFGEVKGTKYQILQTKPITGKTVAYLLEVPVGYADIRLGHKNDENFDESAFETLLHTLKVESPA